MPDASTVFDLRSKTALVTGAGSFADLDRLHAVNVRGPFNL